MDTTAQEIVFTETGCNFCEQALQALNNKKYDEFYVGKGDYDCLIGLSGGVDSSTVLHYAVWLGLKPLCFSVDNGWNDPKADENIMRMVETLKVPFIRYTIDLPKFKVLQAAFLRAGVKNVEIPTDHVLMAVTLKLASEYGIKNILTGGNVATESIMPASWGYNARDLTHIRDIYKKLTGKKLTGLPTCSLLQWNYYKWVKGIRFIPLLDYFNYNRKDAIELLEEKYGFQSTGEKHEENIWTRWFQNFYLFEKFNIDKRKAHLSSMIVSGQVTRKDALDIINERPVYPELGIEKKVMAYKKHDYTDYKTDEKLYNFMCKAVKKLR